MNVSLSHDKKLLKKIKKLLANSFKTPKLLVFALSSVLLCMFISQHSQDHDQGRGRIVGPLLLKCLSSFGGLNPYMLFVLAWWIGF